MCLIGFRDDVLETVRLPERGFRGERVVCNAHAALRACMRGLPYKRHPPCSQFVRPGFAVKTHHRGSLWDACGTVNLEAYDLVGIQILQYIDMLRAVPLNPSLVAAFDDGQASRLVG